MKHTLYGGDTGLRRLRVKLQVPGLERNRVMSEAEWGLLAAIATRLDLPFAFETRGEWRIIRPKGYVLNSAAIAQYGERRRERDIQQGKLRDTQAYIDELNGGLRDRPRFIVLSEDMVKRFVGTVAQRDDIVEAGVAGEVLSSTPPRFEVQQDAVMALRLQPVRFRKFVMGREFWAITPPMPFTLHVDRIMAQATGHPHVYPDKLTLCVGDARFDYGNPFQVVDMLREWYVGYAPKDVADKDWVRHSKMWWRANGEEWLAREDARLIEAPNDEREKSEVSVLSPLDLERFCRGNGWVAGEVIGVPEAPPAPPPVRMAAWEAYGQDDYNWTNLQTVDYGVCCMPEHAAPADARARLTGRRGGQGVTFLFCACHLAELNLAEQGSDRLRDRTNAQPLPQDVIASMCGGGLVYGGFPVTTLHATHIVGDVPLCAGHARLFTSHMPDVQPAAPRPEVEMEHMVLRGEMGAGQALNQGRYHAQFPARVALGWHAPCARCGEELQSHWGITCPREAPFRLAAEHPLNRTDDELWSRWDFDDDEALQGVLERVAHLKAEVGGKARPKNFSSFQDMVRRLKAANGSELDGPEGARTHWVVDTLRKFGPDVRPGTLCLDCFRPWAEGEAGARPHNGPDCVPL